MIRDTILLLEALHGKIHSARDIKIWRNPDGGLSVRVYAQIDGKQCGYEQVLSKHEMMEMCDATIVDCFCYEANRYFGLVRESNKTEAIKAS